MAQTTLWLVLVASGVGLMWAMRWTPGWADAVMIRVAAALYVGAGIVGAGGWIGEVLAWMVRTINLIGAGVGVVGLGTGAIWVAWAALSVGWILTMLPDRWFSRQIPDWLAYAGLILPTAATVIPGALGEALTGLFAATGTLMISAVSGLFGGAA